MIVVAGEALIDLLVTADGSVTASPGGGPFNTARAIARLGVPVTFLGRLSGDRFGRSMAALLAADAIRIVPPEPAAEPTTLAVAEIAGGQARYRFYMDGTAAPSLLPNHLVALADEPPAAVHVGTLGLLVEPMASTLEGYVLGLAAEVLVVVDPNPRPETVRDLAAYRRRLDRVLGRADVVKVSREDMAVVRPGLPAEAEARALLPDRGPDGAAGPAAVLLTDGADPVLVVTAAGERRVAVPSVDVVDTVGAGDAFGGAFLAWWVAAGHDRRGLADPDLVAAGVRVAVEVASATSTRAGADPPRRSELPALAALWPEAERDPA